MAKNSESKVRNKKYGNNFEEIVCKTRVILNLIVSAKC